MDSQPLLVTSFTHMLSGDPASSPVAPSPRASGLETRSAVAPIPWLSVLLYVGVSPVLYIPHTQPTPGLGFLFSKSHFCLPLPLLIQLKVKAQDRAHSREPHMDARRAKTLHPQSSQQSLRPRLLGQHYHRQALSRPS